MAQLILIVDDDASVLASLSLVLKQAGYAPVTAATPEDALKSLRDRPASLVLQDMNFSRQTSGEEGLRLLADIKALYPKLPVILMTAWGSISLAVQGVKLGAADFVTKPWTNEQILHSVKTTLGLSAAPVASSMTRDELDARYDFQPLLGRDPKLLRILELIGRVASTDAPVLITGESGTGKELIADAIHRNSPRKSKPFVKVNLGSITPSLFESELFGHVKGAFTDARADRKGRFDAAHTGSIFLDEIGDLDFSCQVKLLRVLQDRTYEAVGSSETKSVDVRVISATNRSLSEMIAAGTFREDLLYRLNLIAIHLPPLRERTGDIFLLASHFLQSAATLYRRDRMTLSDSAVRWLQSRPWPGNIRELKHVIERTVLVASSHTLTETDFSLAVSMQLSAQTGSPDKKNLPSVGSMTLEEIEKAMILKTIEHHAGNISKVAETLGLSRAALYRRLEKYSITL